MSAALKTSIIGPSLWGRVILRVTNGDGASWCANADTVLHSIYAVLAGEKADVFNRIMGLATGTESMVRIPAMDGEAVLIQRV